MLLLVFAVGQPDLWPGRGFGCPVLGLDWLDVLLARTCPVVGPIPELFQFAEPRSLEALVLLSSSRLALQESGTRHHYRAPSPWSLSCR